MDNSEVSNLEITYKEYKKQMELPGKEALLNDTLNDILIDIRDDSSTAYGMIPGAVHIPTEELENRMGELPQNTRKVLYCSKGVYSAQVAAALREKGINAVSLKGGYTGWLLESMQEENESDDAGKRAEEIEKSIRKKFHKALFSKFAQAINRYDMIQENDKIAVCISGGKDSMLMAKLFQELKRHNKFPFELVFLVMDPGYSQANRTVIENNAKMMNIPITVFESDIFDAVYDVEKSPCYLCARMRRGYLYSRAKELGCNKIALGHHYDDVIETILMGMLYGGQVQTMMPKLHSTNFEGMELIRPMYLIREDDIKHWRDYNDLHFIQCACRFTDTCTTCRTDGSSPSKRMEIKNLIAQLKETNPFVEGNIFKSVENVNLSTIVAYKKDGVRHSFLDDY
jgi:tRNA(Ile)-lysidine synthase TilS/MesJ/rhodanese-related sulfurtransferase